MTPTSASAAMSGDEPVDDDEVLLRRYSTTAPGHIKPLFDEGGAHAILGGNALDFRHEGCSVHRVRVLESHAIALDAVRHPTYSSIARFQAGAVRSFSLTLPDGSEVSPFDVVPTPWVQGREGAPAIDVAHASVTWDTTVAAKPSRPAKAALARLAVLDANEAVVPLDLDALDDPAP